MTAGVRQRGRGDFVTFSVCDSRNGRFSVTAGTGRFCHKDVAIRDANKYFFVDTNAITTYVYALDYHGCAPEYLSHLADANARRYDLLFLCEDDIPYDDTRDRSGDQKRHVFQRQILTDLHNRKLPYIPLSGSLEERMAQVNEELSKYTFRQ